MYGIIKIKGKKEEGMKMTQKPAKPSKHTSDAKEIPTDCKKVKYPDASKKIPGGSSIYKGV